jgi:hypothetical protein
MSTEGRTTGWPAPALMQDECAGLSQTLSKDPAARLHVREAIRMQPRDETAHQFALRKARELIDREEQHLGDVSDGCGESPDGKNE